MLYELTVRDSKTDEGWRVVGYIRVPADTSKATREKMDAVAKSKGVNMKVISHPVTVGDEHLFATLLDRWTK